MNADRRTIVIAAVDDTVIANAVAYRDAVNAADPARKVHVVDASRAVAPGQPECDSRGVSRMVLDPAVPVVAEAPLRASALLAEWLHAHVGIDEPALILLPADGGVAHFSLAQRTQGISTRAATVGVYVTTEPAICAIGRDQLLSEVRVMEQAATTRSALERADLVVVTPNLNRTAILQSLGVHAENVVSVAPDAIGIHEALQHLGSLPSRSHTEKSLPFVSVCVTHYERPDLLQQTLDSIRSQSFANFEVVLVDDGSPSDSSRKMLDRLQPAFDERGWTIVRQDNRYLGAARNAAVRHAKGDFLLFIDDDDCMRPAYIETFARAAVSADADIVTCFLEYFEGREAPRPGTKVHHRWVMPGPTGAGSLVQNTYGGANALVRRDLYDRIGGYTEDHGVGFEDWEFYNRAAGAGARFEVIPRPLLWCRWGIGGMQATAQKHAQQQARASRPVRELMPAAWTHLPQFVQGLHARNRDLIAHVQRLEQELAAARSSEVAASEAQLPVEQAAAATPDALPPRRDPSQLPRHRCHVWHTEGLGLSGILSWMWRLRDQFAPSANVDLRLVDLAVLPYGFQQAGADPSTFYDERVATSQEFLAFLQRTSKDVHVVNHAFAYLTSLMEQLGPDVLKGLKLVGVCHTDQEYYYGNLARLAPVLRKIIAVSPTCATTLASRIPEHAHKIVTLPAWAVELPGNRASIRAEGEPLRLLYTGRILHFQKRVFDLVELATRLRAAKVNAELTIVGDGPDREELEKRVRDAGSRAIPVHFHGVRAPWEMESLLTSHHAFVQVSEFEGASVSLMEALAYGLVPVVTVTRSGHDLLESDVNSLTAPVGDMKRLAAHIALLARDTGRQERIAAGARATAEKYLGELAYPERLASLVHMVAA